MQRTDAKTGMTVLDERGCRRLLGEAGVRVATRLAAAAPGRVTSWTVPGAGHAGKG